MTVAKRTNPPLPEPRSELLWVCVDLDQTLAEGMWSPSNPCRDIGLPITANVAKARQVHRAGYKIVVHTSRPWTDYEAVEQWLGYWDVPWRYIQCGKPLAALYVDDRGRHSESASWLPEAAAEVTTLRAELDHLRAENNRLSGLLTTTTTTS